jgi:hypothetical protein
VDNAEVEIRSRLLVAAVAALRFATWGRRFDVN